MDSSGVKVGIIMGSISDEPIMREAKEFLDSIGVPSEMKIVSAHRTPMEMVDYGHSALQKGLKVIIAGAGGAAHLPGMMASLTPIPVIGVPVKSSISLDGWDSILSILQMPPGIPVATVALNSGRNAGILAAQILATSDEEIMKKIVEFKSSLVEKVSDMNIELNKKLNN